MNTVKRTNGSPWNKGKLVGQKPGAPFQMKLLSDIPPWLRLLLRRWTTNFADVAKAVVIFPFADDDVISTRFIVGFYTVIAQWHGGVSLSSAVGCSILAAQVRAASSFFYVHAPVVIH